MGVTRFCGSIWSVASTHSSVSRLATTAMVTAVIQRAGVPTVLQSGETSSVLTSPRLSRTGTCTSRLGGQGPLGQSRGRDGLVDDAEHDGDQRALDDAEEAALLGEHLLPEDQDAERDDAHDDGAGGRVPDALGPAEGVGDLLDEDDHPDAREHPLDHGRGEELGQGTGSRDAHEGLDDPGEDDGGEEGLEAVLLDRVEDDHGGARGRARDAQGEPLRMPTTMPPTMPATRPENGGAPLARAMPRQRGTATKNTTIPAGTS